MIGMIVPAHNEEALLAPCLAALIDASRHEDLAGEAVRIVVVLDACNDFSGAIARAYGVETLTLKARNVGIARATGADLLLADGARWLAFTDADSRVSRRLAGRATGARGGRGVRLDRGRRLERAPAQRA